MKRILFLLFLLLPGPLHAQRVNIPPVERDTLDNGLTILLMRYTKVPVVTLRLVVPGGSAADPEGRTGAASMMADLLREGTTSRSSAAIASEIDFMGGTLFAGAGLDYCAVTMEVMSKDFDAGLDLFSDVVLNPSFPEEEINRERNQRLAGLEGTKEDPSSIASVVFTRYVYGDHPYGHQSQGTTGSLQELKREDLVRTYRALFVPDGAVLAVVGDIPPDEARAKLSAAFEEWSGARAHSGDSAAPVPLKGTTVVVVNKPDVTQTQIRIGNTGIRANDPDSFPILVANSVFGGGFTSRLVDELRVKRSLTYGAASTFSSSLLGGSYVISTFTRTETTREMLDAIMEQLNMFRASGPTAAEVLKAKNYLVGIYARGLQTPGALATRLTDREVYGYPEDYLSTYVERVRGTAMDEINRVIRQRFLADDLLYVLVMPYLGPVDLPGLPAPEVLGLDEAIR